jgi:imidazolonepropionase-like amidohydrolase
VLISPQEERPSAWVVGGRLTFTEPTSPGLDVRVIEGWVIPGLVDAHCHVGLGAQGAVDQETAEKQALTDRDAGVLLIRDAGQPGDTRWTDDRDDLPPIIRAGRHIARPRRYVRDYAHEIEPEHLVEFVVQEARRGDGWVKLVGDWIERDSGDLAPCWPREALEAAIAAAHAEGARVTAHCFGEDCLPDLIGAGIDCVEHATGLTEESVSLALKHGTAIVPTLVNTENFPAFAAAGEERFPTYAAHMMALFARREATLVAAHEAGVPVYGGTDAGGHLSHGLLPHEVALMVAAGLPPLGALDAACWSSRAWLGRPGLEEGASADVVVLDDDPRADVATLVHPRRVVLRGEVVV